MAAGKSTVGPLLAERLGGRFVDLDRSVERLAGRTIPEIFSGGGETRFRELEARATTALDVTAGLVVAAGGGWMSRPELRNRWPGALRVWLRVSPAELVRRLGNQTADRPMLDPADPEGSARRLLERRRQDYARAEIAVDTDGRSPSAVAAEIERALRRRRTGSADRGTEPGAAP